MTTRTPSPEQKTLGTSERSSLLHRTALAVTLATGAMRMAAAECMAGSTRNGTQSSAVQNVVDRINPVTPAWTTTNDMEVPGLGGGLDLPRGSVVADHAAGHGMIALLLESGDILLYDETTGEMIQRMNGDGRDGLSIVMHPVRQELAVARKGSFSVISATSGNIIDTIKLKRIPMDISIDPAGRFVMITMQAGPVHVYDMDYGSFEPLQKLGQSTLVDSDPLSDSVATESGKNVTVYDGNADAIVRTLKGLKGAVTCLDWDPTGRLIAAGDRKGKISVWDIATGKEVYNESIPALMPVGGVASLSFNADGRTLVAAQDDGSGVIFDVQNMIDGEMEPVIGTFGIWSEASLSPSPDPSKMYVTSRVPGMESTFRAINLIYRGNTAEQQVTPPTEVSPPSPESDPLPLVPAAERDTTDDMEQVPQPVENTSPVTEDSAILPTPSSVPEPEAIEPSTSNADEEAIRQAAVAAIVSQLESPVENANTIGYAKIGLSTETQGYERTAFYVRYRNPGEQTFIEVVIDNGDGSFSRKTTLLQHPGGEADDTWSFTLERRTNGGRGNVEIKLWNGPDKSLLLDMVTASYFAHENDARIITEQLPWEQDEAGRNAESPVVADLLIAKISGATVLFTVASPCDQSYVMFQGDGLLMKQRLTHVGGTLQTPGTVTFNGALPSGYYDLQLFANAGGKMLDSVTFYWNKDMKQLSMLNAGDALTPLAATALPKEIEKFNFMMNIQDVGFDNAQINWIQQMDFYRKSDSLTGPYDLYIDPLQELPSKVRTMIPNFSSMSQYEQGVTQQFYFDALTVYEQAIGELLQKAVDIVVRIRKGEDQQQLINTILLPAYEKWLNPQHRTAWMPYSREIEKLSHLGIYLPSVNVLMETAARVFDIGWVDVLQRQDDMKAVYERMENIAQLEANGLEQLPDGTWVVKDQKRYIASIIAAGGYASYVAQENLPAGVVAAADSIYNDFTVIDQAQPWQRYEYVQSWYNSSKQIPGQSYYVNVQSEVGKMFAGLLQHVDLIHKAYATNTSAREAELIATANYIQQLTDIPYKKILIAASATSEAERFAQMRALFETGNYGKIFLPDNIATPHMISAVNDLPSYTNGNVRVRFDINTGGKQISHLRFYLMADGRQIGGALTADVRGQSFVDIPVEKIMEMFHYEGMPPTLNVQIKAVAWFEGENDSAAVSTKTDPFMVKWDGSSVNTGVNGVVGNAEIVSHLRNSILPTLVNGVSPDTGFGGQCKEWVTEQIRDLTGGRLILPRNLGNNAIDGYAWELNNHPNIEPLAQKFKNSGDPRFFSNTMLNGGVGAGDIVQMTGVGEIDNFELHTMIVDRVEEDGVWVFDSNWNDPQDETVRYHFLNNSFLDTKVNAFTIYRLRW